jgi:hypothetical protein
MTAISLVGVLFAAFYALADAISAPAAGLLALGLGEVRPGEAFRAGAITTPLLMAAGFSVWWAVYWLRRR